MPARRVSIHWPEGHTTAVEAGCPWLQAARLAGVTIPTGCLAGSCGACEIEVNGRVVRACIAAVPPRTPLQVELAVDPFW
ncbi:MAG: 2Fe-2S iron-sulfur cluster binding domain-containing protein [Cyanobacteria bacterium J06638_7]